ncbi:MAG: hypothetical protein EOP09_06375, partial [Proteobacteria bacterium]
MLFRYVALIAFGFFAQTALAANAPFSVRIHRIDQSGQVTELPSAQIKTSIQENDWCPRIEWTDPSVRRAADWTVTPDPDSRTRDAVDPAGFSTCLYSRRRVFTVQGSRKASDRIVYDIDFERVSQPVHMSAECQAQSVSAVLGGKTSDTLTFVSCEPPKQTGKRERTLAAVIEFWSPNTSGYSLAKGKIRSRI